MIIFSDLSELGLPLLSVIIEVLNHNHSIFLEDTPNFLSMQVFFLYTNFKSKYVY